MAKKQISEQCASIVDAICYWQGYQSKIGRERFIHEASLRYPVADTITAEGIAIERVVLEKPHPIFIRKRIDLVIYEEDKREIDGDEYLKAIFEFKLAKKTTCDKYSNEHQRIFSDIVRLAFYNLKNKGKECYFLMS